MRNAKPVQRAINRHARRLDLPTIEVDGVAGPETRNRGRQVAYYLGLRPKRHRELPPELRRKIRDPAARTDAEKRRGRKRTKRRMRKLAARARGPQAALREARKYLGRTEQPYGSNLAPWGLSDWIKRFLGLSYGVPWCGIFVGRCLETAGVNVTGRVAAVAYIYADAGNGTNGFARRVSVTDGEPGDAVGLFGISTHVGLIEKRVPGGYQTIEGNTSSGTSGSQSNGGGCYRRFRPYAHVAYVARPAYPGA